jgi:hypothetical protein
MFVGHRHESDSRCVACSPRHMYLYALVESQRVVSVSWPGRWNRLPGKSEAIDFLAVGPCLVLVGQPAQSWAIVLISTTLLD